MTFTLNVTHLPNKFGFPMCLPKQCDKSDYFKGYLDGIAEWVNVGLVEAKKLVNFDNLYNNMDYFGLFFVYSGDQNLKLMNQLTNIVSNETNVTLIAY